MFLSRFLAPVLLSLVAGFTSSVFAQGFKQELETPEKISVSIRNIDGRVSVIASAEHEKKMVVEGKSAGQTIASDDVKVDVKGTRISIDVRPRGEKDRIDLVVTVPPRSRIEVEGQAGAVDVVGNVESAVV